MESIWVECIIFHYIQNYYEIIVYLSFLFMTDILSNSSYPQKPQPNGLNSVFSSSSILDVPMQMSTLSQTIRTYQVWSVNQRKFLDLDLFNYDFNVEMSVLNDQK